MILLVLQEDKIISNSMLPAQIIAEVIATCQYNNKKWQTR